MKTGSKPTEALSRLALYAVIGLAVVVYALFMLIGYDLPLATDPTFSAPLLTPLLIAFVELTLRSGFASSKIVCSERNSASSFLAVPVPCAFTYATSFGSMPDFSIA